MEYWMNRFVRHLPVSFAIAVLCPLRILAHGPQIQITNDNNQIVTRQLHLEGPYSTSLTDPTSVYVMPLDVSAEVAGNVWYSRPNGAINGVTMLPSYTSGPGLAYGFGYDPLVPATQKFATGSLFSITFTDGLKKWNGSSFVDAGDTQLKAFRGSNVAIGSPVENFATTSDAGPFDSVSLPAVAEGYGADDDEVHNSVRWALLGDGSSPYSSVADGVYLLSLQLSSTQPNLGPSDEYYFVLHKGAPFANVQSAVNSLQAPAGAVQYVPEPSGILTLALAGTLFAAFRHRRTQGTCY
jgi:hypothetical protein